MGRYTPSDTSSLQGLNERRPKREVGNGSRGVGRCDRAVAELLVGPETTLLYFSLGTKLGERVGWPAERVHQLSDEKEELLRISASNTLIPVSCAAISRINTFVDERARVGEIGALRGLRDQREPSGQPMSR